MEEQDQQLLARVLKHPQLLESVLLADNFGDWSLVRDLGEFFTRMVPDDIMGHALLVKACRHTGDIKRALEELKVSPSARPGAVTTAARL